MLHITYEGKKLPIKISYYALKHAINHHREKTGREISMENIMGAGMEIYEPLLYYGLKAGHKKEDKKFSFKMEDMEFMLDDVMMEFIEVVASSFPAENSKQQEGVVQKKK